MATRAGNRNDSSNTRIRCIILEADGDVAGMQQIAQAIATAVRPTFAQIPFPQATLVQHRSSSHALEAPAEMPVEVVDTDDIAALPRKPSGNGHKKKLPTPVVLDIDLTSGPVPFTQYVQEKNPGNHTKRYLVIAAWLKEYRQLDEITIDHIYTCYRKLKLNVLPDVGSVFRGAKKQAWFHSGSQPGQYVINHIGLGQVNDMGNND